MHIGLGNDPGRGQNASQHRKNLSDGRLSSHDFPAKTGANNQNRVRVMMSNWTISRRIIAGFITIVLITVGVGGFALWRLEWLGRNISDLPGHTPPPVFTPQCA